MHPVLVETHRISVITPLDGGDRPPAPLYAAPQRRFLKRTLARLILWGGATVLVAAGWLFNCVLCHSFASQVLPKDGDWIVMSALQCEVQEVFRSDPRFSALMVARYTVPLAGYRQLEVVGLLENLLLTLPPATLAELEINVGLPDLGSDPRAVSLEQLCESRYGAERVAPELERLQRQGFITAARAERLRQKTEERL